MIHRLDTVLEGKPLVIAALSFYRLRYSSPLPNQQQ